jgi:aspartate/methionine/tyrosine aminotransferase
MVEEYQQRRDRMVNLVRRIPEIIVRKPMGAFYLFPNISAYGMSSAEIAHRLIDEAGVAVLAGTDFGAGGEGYIRLVFAVAMDVIEEGLEKITNWFASR